MLDVPLYIADAVRDALPLPWMHRRISALIITPFDLDTYLIRISIAVFLGRADDDPDLHLAAAAVQSANAGLLSVRPMIRVDHERVPPGVQVMALERFPDVLCFARRDPEQGGQRRKLHAYLGAVDVARFEADGHLAWIVKPQVIELVIGSQPVTYASVAGVAHIEQRPAALVLADAQAGRYEARPVKGLRQRGGVSLASDYLIRLDSAEEPVLTPDWVAPELPPAIRCRIGGAQRLPPPVFNRALRYLKARAGQFDRASRTWTALIPVSEYATLPARGISIEPMERACTSDPLDATPAGHAPRPGANDAP